MKKPPEALSGGFFYARSDVSNAPRLFKKVQMLGGEGRDA